MRSSPYLPHPAFTTQEHIDEIACHEVQFVIDPRGPSKFRLKSMETKEHWMVGIGSEQTCTCNDSEVCVHILYIMMRYFGVPKDCDILWQRSLTDHEIDIVLDGRVKRQPQAKPQPIYKTKSGKSKVKRLPIGDEDVCPICYDSLKECDKSKIAWCRLGCGGNFHRKCVKAWIESQRNSGKDPLCPICRQCLDMLGINPPPKKPPSNASPPLSEAEIRDLMNREITPDDYDLLLKLDQCPNCTQNHQPIRRNPISNQQRRIAPKQNQNQRIQAANRILRDQLDLQVTGTTAQQENSALPTREQPSSNRQVAIRRVNQNQNRRPIDPNPSLFIGEVTGNHIASDNQNENNHNSYLNGDQRINQQHIQRPVSQLPLHPQPRPSSGRILITGIGNFGSPPPPSNNNNPVNPITPAIQPQIKTPAPWHGGGGGNNKATSKRNIVIPPKRPTHSHPNPNVNESPQFLVSNFNIS